MLEYSRQAPSDHSQAALLNADAASWPILICMLGPFRLLQMGRRVAIRGAGKTEALLCYLGLYHGLRIPRETLVDVLWPDSDPALGRQSLNSLIYHLHKLVGNSLGGAPLVVHDDGQYQLNADGGVGVDVSLFEWLAQAGDRRTRIGDQVGAVEIYTRAAHLYRGDLCSVPGVHAILVRERQRSRYLTLLAQIANYHYSVEDYAACMSDAWRLLDVDPCREDAHRLIMRCYVRRGERAAALRHYDICTTILRAEIDAEPEPTTSALLQQIRHRPEAI